MHASLWGALLGLSILASAEGPLDGAPYQADLIAARAASSSIFVVQAEATLVATGGRRAQARGLVGNPTLQGSVDLGGDRVGAQLSQPLSLSGQGRAERLAAGLGADAARLELERARLEAAAAARASFAAACAAVEMRRIAQEGAHLATRLSRAIQARVDAGEAAALDAQLGRLAEAQAHRGHLAAAIDEASALQALSEWAQEEVVAARLPKDPLAAVPAPSGAEAEGHGRLDLRAARLRIEGAQAQVAVARAQAAPPVSVGVFYEREMDHTFLGPGLSFALPVFDRAQEARGRAAGAGAVALAQESALQARIAAELATTAELRAIAEAASAVAEAAGDATLSEVLSGLERGYAAGEIDLATTLSLQSQALVGAASAVALERDSATAWLSWMLANEDPALLGGSSP